MHVEDEGIACGQCHSGYTANSVNSSTHQNGAVNVSSFYNASNGSCAQACHGSEKWGATSSGGGSSGGGSGSCGSCHAVPPGSGEHSKHVEDEGISCGQCHSGYTANSVNSSTHQNGAVNVSSFYNASSGSCARACHGSEKWGSTGSGGGSGDDDEGGEDDDDDD